MADIVSLKPHKPFDRLPSEAGKLNFLCQDIESVFEEWAYLPFWPSLFQHGAQDKAEFRQSLSDEIHHCIPLRLKTSQLPMRLWYGGVVLKPEKGRTTFTESYEMGAELVGAEELAADAEMMAIAIEILKRLQVRDYRLVIGHGGFLKGLLKTDPKGARKKVSILRGEEEMIDQAQSLSLEEMATEALGELKALSRWLREFGYKGLIHYDLNPFLDEEGYSAIMFKVVSGFRSETILSGGRRRVGDWSTVGFSTELPTLLSVVNQIGLPLPSPKIDFLLVNRKKSRKSAIEIMRVLREHGYSVALNYSDLNKEELMDYARRAGMLNMIIIGDEGVAINEVRLVDVIDKVATKVKISDVFNEKSGINKLLRYHRRLELDI